MGEKLKYKLELETKKRIEIEQILSRMEEKEVRLQSEYEKLKDQNKKISQENEEIALTLSSIHQKDKNKKVEDTNRRELENEITDLKKSKKVIESRCLNAERVLHSLTMDNIAFENKENQEGFESGVFEDHLSPNSRPSSRRRELQGLDLNIVRKSNGMVASGTEMDQMKIKNKNGMMVYGTAMDQMKIKN